MGGVDAMHAHKASKKAGYNKIDRKATNVSNQSSSTPLDTTEATPSDDLSGEISSDDAKAIALPIIQAQILPTRNLTDNLNTKPAPARSTGGSFVPPHLRHTIPNVPECAVDSKGAVEDLITF
jgi:hypothetical protein